MSKVCTFSECGRISVSRGLCNSHMKQRENGKKLTPIKSKSIKCAFPNCKGTCSVEKQYCSSHRKQIKRGVPLTPIKQKPELMTCVFIGCDRRRDSADGYCSGHKKQLKAGKPLTTFRVPILICTFGGCGRRHYRGGLCNPHDRQKLKGLKLTPIKTQNKAGEGSLSTHGYKVYCKIINGKKVYLYEHRTVMEKYLGRVLLLHENIHHINGNRLDNRIENLELWSSHQPHGQRVLDKIIWAQEILNQYSKEISLLNNLQSSSNNILFNAVGGESNSHILFE